MTTADGVRTGSASAHERSDSETPPAGLTADCRPAAPAANITDTPTTARPSRMHPSSLFRRSRCRWGLYTEDPHDGLERRAVSRGVVSPAGGGPPRTGTTPAQRD